VAEPPPPVPELREPWRTGGLLAPWRQRRLVWRLSRSQRARRLQGTVLRGTWDYINPLVQFTVYFVVIGVLLGLNRRVENFPLYIFSGLVTVQYFNNGLNGATGSFTNNRQMVRRAAFPRQLLPASHLVTQAIGLGPPLVVLLIAAVALGWRPDAVALLLALAGFVLLAAFTYGCGLIFGVANVFIRDTTQVVGVITTLARWATPVIYPWDLVQERFGDSIITILYLANPVTIAVFGAREAFWHPTVEEGLPPMPVESLVIGILITIAAVILGHVLLHRYQYRLVQRVRWST
jgi:ABC-2 type transport system permease protein